MPVKKLPLPRFEVWKSKKDKNFYARFIGKNGKEVWRTSEGYTRRRGAMSAINLFFYSGIEVIVDLSKGSGSQHNIKS